ncbi:hypothetical protein PIB30_065930 [Stylosanthes scabra]|uniref:Uncharacterized protein n=1 Tax=Stylosanthes scabra TaxID=79078 RepID=A0ABU6WQH3_9FABA|nr:hypothetical protein [Stylosanthes scabra]
MGSSSSLPVAVSDGNGDFRRPEMFFVNSGDQNRDGNGVTPTFDDGFSSTAMVERKVQRWWWFLHERRLVGHLPPPSFVLDLFLSLSLSLPSRFLSLGSSAAASVVAAKGTAAAKPSFNTSISLDSVSLSSRSLSLFSSETTTATAAGMGAAGATVFFLSFFLFMRWCGRWDERGVGSD